MSKPFDPFAEDENTETGVDALEFQPDQERTRIEAVPEQSTETVVKPPPPKPLRIDFSELADQDGDLRGAAAIGSEELPSDEFLRGLKKRDYDQALDRAVAAQRMVATQSADEGQVVRKVRTPLYVLALVVALFAAALVAGGYVFKHYAEKSEAEKIEALRRAQP